MSDDERLVEQGAVDVTAACAFTGLGRTFLYGLMERGLLRYVKLGKRRLIPRAELVRLLADGLAGSPVDPVPHAHSPTAGRVQSLGVATKASPIAKTLN